MVPFPEPARSPDPGRTGVLRPGGRGDGLVRAPAPAGDTPRPLRRGPRAGRGRLPTGLSRSVRPAPAPPGPALHLPPGLLPARAGPRRPRRRPRLRPPLVRTRGGPRPAPRRPDRHVPPAGPRLGPHLDLPARHRHRPTPLDLPRPRRPRHRRRHPPGPRRPRFPLLDRGRLRQCGIDAARLDSRAGWRALAQRSREVQIPHSGSPQRSCHPLIPPLREASADPDSAGTERTLYG